MGCYTIFLTSFLPHCPKRSSSRRTRGHGSPWPVSRALSETRRIRKKPKTYLKKVKDNTRKPGIYTRRIKELTRDGLSLFSTGILSGVWRVHSLNNISIPAATMTSFYKVAHLHSAYSLFYRLRTERTKRHHLSPQISSSIVHSEYLPRVPSSCIEYIFCTTHYTTAT